MEPPTQETSGIAPRYPVELEVAAPLAMFSRPDTGGTPTSYPVPTWSAAKGLFEAIAFLADGAAWICPTKIEVCRRVNEPGGRVSFQQYTTNYGGPLRKTSLLKKGLVSGGSGMQLFATVLSNVCYRLHGAVVGPRQRGNINTRHYLKALFDRRLDCGKCYRTPCMGWSEFTCSYWGPFRNNLMIVDTALTLEVPSMLLGVWNQPVNGGYAPEYRQEVKVNAGVLYYDLPIDWLNGVS